MTNLTGAVHKTMNFVFTDIENSTNEIKKRINSLKANIGRVANIPIDEIETGKNIRSSIDTKSDSFLRLVESIKKFGVLENVVVELRINKKESAYKLVCIAGHRRILAAKEAKIIARIPCLLQSYEKKGDKVGAALAENLNREGLHCLDVADGYKSLTDSGWGEEDLVKHFCRNVRTIRHYLKMAMWSDSIKQLLRNNPKLFSTRAIMRKFAYKKFGSEADLKAAITTCLTKTQAQPVTSARQKSNLKDKKTLKLALTNYLSQQKLLSDVIKDEIKKAFTELKLI